MTLPAIWIVMHDGGYDGDAPCDARLSPVWAREDTPVAGYESEAAAESAIDAYNERARQHHHSHFNGYTMEVRVG